MRDRVPMNPGRVLITPENGNAAYYATMTRADNPTQEGDPLNKNTLLKDSTAALFGLGADAVPDDVFVEISEQKANNSVTYTATVTNNWTQIGDYYYQDVAVPGIIETDAPIVDILPGSDAAANKIYSDNICKVISVSTGNGSVQVCAVAAITTAFPIQLKVVG